MNRTTRAILAAAALILASFAIGGSPASAHGTPYSCNIPGGANLLTHWGCGRAWRNSSGGISGYFQDRHNDGSCVQAWAGGGGGVGFIGVKLGSSCTTTPVYFSTGNGPKLQLCLGSSSTCVNYTP